MSDNQPQQIREETPLLETNSSRFTRYCDSQEYHRHVQPIESTDKVLRRTENLIEARNLLYTSHFFAQASEVSWQFCLVLFLSAFTNYESLALVSTYGLMSGLAVCLAGGAAGKYVDTTPRLHAARVFIWTENCAVLLATLCCYFLLREPQDLSSDPNSPSSSWMQNRFYGVEMDFKTILLLLGLHVLGSLANVLDRGFMVAIERDWVVVMSQEAGNIQHENQQTPEVKFATERDWLSQTNVTMRQIDLSCKVVAPTIAGYIVVAFGEDKTDLRSACIFVGILNVLSLLAEYECTARIYKLVPLLGEKVLPDELLVEDKNDQLLQHLDSSIMEDEAYVDFAEADITHWSPASHANIDIQDASSKCLFMPSQNCLPHKEKSRHCFPFPSEWLIYLKQDVAPAGIALAFL